MQTRTTLFAWKMFGAGGAGNQDVNILENESLKFEGFLQPINLCFFLPCSWSTSLGATSMFWNYGRSTHSRAFSRCKIALNLQAPWQLSTPLTKVLRHMSGHILWLLLLYRTPQNLHDFWKTSIVTFENAFYKMKFPKVKVIVFLKPMPCLNLSSSSPIYFAPEKLIGGSTTGACNSLPKNKMWENMFCIPISIP